MMNLTDTIDLALKVRFFARKRGGFKKKQGYPARRTFPCTPSKAPSTSSQ